MYFVSVTVSLSFTNYFLGGATRALTHRSAEAKLAKMPSDRDSDYATTMLERKENKKFFLRPGQSDIKDIEDRHCTDVHPLARSAPEADSPGFRALNQPQRLQGKGGGGGGGASWCSSSSCGPGC